MQLPIELRYKIESAFGKEYDIRALISSAIEISESYRLQETHNLNSRSHILAYLAARLPATYAATKKVLAEIINLEIGSILELGSGIGVALWAAKDLFPKLKEAHLFERNPLFISLGQELAKELNLTIKWKKEDICKGINLPPSDLVTLSYVTGELPPSHLEPLIKEAYSLAQQALVIIEPGTPRGFERILQIRKWLLERGAYILAPCSHNGLCPMQGKDWCHFSVRLARSSLHKKLKKGEMSYEDEKFSYLIASPHNTPRTRGKRILKEPIERKGHVILDLCEPNNVNRQIITRKDPLAYKQAKKSNWGDEWLGSE